MHTRLHLVAFSLALVAAACTSSSAAVPGDAPQPVAYDAFVSESAHASFYGYGTGLAFGIPGELQGRVQYARPFPGAEPTSDGDDDRWWFELTYQF